MRLPNPQTETISLIKEAGDSDPERRYKLVYNYHPEDRGFYTVRTATSADGLNWTAGPELPIDESDRPLSRQRYCERRR